ncbi:MAG: archaeosine synthase subunit alpha [Halobacteria archaeon]
MTDYFEVLERDFGARLGKLRLDDGIVTPAVIPDDVLQDYGSLWTGEREQPEGDSSKVTILPHRAMPSGTPKEVVQEKQPRHPETEFPSAAVVSHQEPAADGHDVYILTGVEGGNSRDLVVAVVNARNRLESDSLLLLPASATPRNVSLLAYLGVDGFDVDNAVVKGKGGVYMTDDLEIDVGELTELPCRCSVCSDSTPEDITREEVARHNVLALEAEVSRVRDKIRNGRLREYVETQVGRARWMTEALRLLDHEYEDYVESRTAVFRRSQFDSNSMESLYRPDIRRFMDRVTERFSAPRNDCAVFLPCSARKPYSESDSHEEFQSRIRGRAHEVVLTSPVGVVPRELELTYPASHYDTPVTGWWSPTEKELVGEVLESYLEKNRYDRIVAHLPREGYGEIFESVCGKLDLEYEFTAGDLHPRDDDALGNLEEAVSEENQANYDIQDKWIVKGVMDYQFGEGVFDEFFGLGGVRTEGRFPRLRFFDRDGQIGTLVPGYGSLALTLYGAEKLPVAEVEIDDFVPSGSVLAPGVIDADEIRVGDEVYFEGPSAWGVGRAGMFGREMRESTRGITVDVRHVEEK